MRRFWPAGRSRTPERPEGPIARRRRVRPLRGLAPLANRDFRLFFVGWATTRFGRSMEEIAAVWLMYELTRSPTLLGMLGLARAIPAILLGPIAGAVADRVDQRTLLCVTQALGGLTSLVGGTLVVTDLVVFWHLYVIVLAQAACDAFDGSARLALYPRLVRQSQLADAVSLNSLASRTAQLAGPVAGGVLIATSGVAAPFFANAVTFGVLIGALLFMRGLPSLVAPGSSLARQVLDSLRHIANAPVLSGLLKLEVVVGIFQVNPVIVTIVAREILNVGPRGLGVLLAGPAVGSLLAVTALLSVGHPGRQGRFVLLSGAAYATALGLLAGSRMYVVTLLVLVFIGLADGGMTVVRHSVMQMVAPPSMRGRIMGWMGMTTRGVSPLGELQSGTVSGAIGPIRALLLAGGALGAASVATAMRNRPLWSLTAHRQDPAATADAVLPARSPEVA